MKGKGGKNEENIQRGLFERIFKIKWENRSMGTSPKTFIIISFPSKYQEKQKKQRRKKISEFFFFLSEWEKKDEKIFWGKKERKKFENFLLTRLDFSQKKNEIFINPTEIDQTKFSEDFLILWQKQKQ